MEKKKIEYLVADTAAFIQNKALQDLADHVVTCQKVIDEVKSKRQLRRLAVLPYELEIKDVFPENIKFVHEMAKQSGDYHSLSATDIEVIALTYQLEKEKVGDKHLKTKVEMQKSISFTNHSTVDFKGIAGFYLPSGKTGDVDQLSDKLKKLTSEEGGNLDEDKLSEDSDPENHSDRLPEDGSEEEDRKEEKTTNDAIDDVEPLPVEDLALEGSLPALNEETTENSENIKVEDLLVKVTSNEEPKSEENDENDSDYDEDGNSDDEAGWITPENVKQAKIDMDHLDYEDEEVKVACITTDFAMQNVMKQIGLKVASVDGRVIKQIRTYIFRCYGCFKTTDDMTKVFCPNCGHNTLKRVSVTLEPDGSYKMYINIKRPLTARGRRFQLPAFKGGKHSNNPWVTADQRFPDQKPTRVARTKTNIMESDYIEGYSPFAVRDTNSRSAVLGIRDQKRQRRPNFYKPRVGKKK